MSDFSTSSNGKPNQLGFTFDTETTLNITLENPEDGVCIIATQGVNEISINVQNKEEKIRLMKYLCQVVDMLTDDVMKNKKPQFNIPPYRSK